MWGQDRWILAKFVFFACSSSRSINSQKERGQYPAILRDTAGSPERLARFGNQLQRAIWAILTANGASHITMAFITWLAPREGKMNKLLHCDSLPERWRWSYLALSGQPAVSRKKFPLKPYSKSFIDQACLVKMAGYWPRSFFASLWTSTSSRSINTQKRNLPNIQPSWSHTWSILHIYFVPVIYVWPEAYHVTHQINSGKWEF